MRLGTRLRLVLLALMVLWAVFSLRHLPPLDGSPTGVAEQVPALLAVPAIALYGFAAVRYLQLWRRRRTPMLLAMMGAFVLLAESMMAIAFARSWHLSWWEWHVLMLVAFGLVALGARHSWREERFADLYLSDTVAGDREMSVLFADLQGFTTFSEGHRPDEVTAMLNAYFAVAVPAVVVPYGGDVDRIIGDALMVTFNKRGDQPDHARRAAGAGLALQVATAAGRRRPPGVAAVPRRHQLGPGHGQPARHRRRAHAHGHRRHGQHRLAHRGQGPGRRRGGRTGHQGAGSRRRAPRSLGAARAEGQGRAGRGPPADLAGLSESSAVQASLLSRPATNRSSAGSSEVSRCTSSPPSQLNRPTVTRCASRDSTRQSGARVLPAAQLVDVRRVAHGVRAFHALRSGRGGTGAPPSASPGAPGRSRPR